MIPYGLALITTIQLLIASPSVHSQQPAPATDRLHERARPVTDRGLDNLVAFSRLLGYVRHFHPSEAVERGDWSRIAITGLLKAEEARDVFELCVTLEQHFVSIAPTLRVHPAGQAGALPSALSPPRKYWSLGVAYWEHTGFRPGSRAHIFGWRYIHALRDGERPATAPDPAATLSADLGGGVVARVPVALWTDRERTLPQPKPDRAAFQLPAQVAGDPAYRFTRLATVALGWNAIQHLYPHFADNDRSWDARLPGLLRQAALAQDTASFTTLVRRMMIPLQDGQTMTLHASLSHPWAPGILWRWIEDRLVITYAEPALASKVRRGDLVTKIGGRPTSEVLAEKEGLVGASTAHHRRHLTLLEMLMGPKAAPMQLTLSRPGGNAAVVRLDRPHRGPYGLLARARGEAAPMESRPDPISQIVPGIWYLDFTRITDVQFQNRLPELEKARGLVFDLRGKTPGVSDFPLAFFSKEVMTSPTVLTPRIRKPDRLGWDWNRGTWNVVPDKLLLSARKVFLCDERTQGTAEVIAWLARRYKLGDLVGSPTAGATGMMSMGRFPGGYSLGWSAQRYQKLDGSFFKGSGVQPTLPLRPTVSSIRAGKDALVEKALELLR